VAAGHRLLEDALALVCGGWTQCADARARDGTSVAAWSPLAASWSLLGALVAAYSSRAADDEERALAALIEACRRLAQVLDTYDLDAWNNAPVRTQADVADALERALALPAPPPPSRTITLN
jgi:hypothetical protein